MYKEYVFQIVDKKRPFDFKGFYNPFEIVINKILMQGLCWELAHAQKPLTIFKVDFKLFIID